MNATTQTVLETVVSFYEKTQFSWHDYGFFIILLLFSVFIGVYFGFCQKRNESADDYLLGGKSMGVFEISMSLIASTISGITVISVPSEVYRYGFTYWLTIFSGIIILFFSYFYILPVFTKLKTPSTYEYVKSRFEESVRVLSSFLFTVSMLCYLPIVIYIPALALAQGTGYNIHYITAMICGVCIFYTTIGGLKAVVWTDALQLVVMIGATLVVSYIGTAAVGGVSEVISVAHSGGRLDLDFDLNPTKRDTFWTVFVGMLFFWSAIIAFGQGTVQKCLALPNMKKIRLAYIIFGIGIITFFNFSIYLGFMLFSKYKDCDPYTSRKIKTHDQILPFYILDITESIPGLLGIFVAGVLSASLSTVSAAMNALSCTICEDFILPHLSKDINQHVINIILKTIVVVVGVICLALTFLVQKFKSLLEIGLTIWSFAQGPNVGLFILGMFVPKANTKGAWIGIIGAMCILGWLLFSNLYFKMVGLIVYPTKAISVANCVMALNTTFREFYTAPEEIVPAIYRISHYYYTMLGCILVLIIGIPVSYLTHNEKKPQVKKDLISPLMHWALKQDNAIILPDYDCLEIANQKVFEKK